MISTPEVFPDEFIEEALLKLPTKALIRFKCVSKPWRDRISDPSFARAYQQHNKPFVVALDSRESGMMVLLDKKDGHGELTEKKRLRIPWSYDPNRYLFSFECSCNDFLCFTMRPTTENKVVDVVFWNPNIGIHKEFFVIELKLEGDKHRFGIGYDSSISNYKLVKIIIKTGRPCKAFVSKVEVSTMNSDIWRQVSYNLACCVSDVLAAVSLHGGIYWLASDEREEKIARFDLVNEKFTAVSLPVMERGRGVISISEREGRLCIGSHNMNSRDSMDIWVMVEKSRWVKLFSLSQQSTQFPSRLCFIGDSALVEKWLPERWLGTYYIDDVKMKTEEGLNLSVPVMWQTIMICTTTLVSFNFN